MLDAWQPCVLLQILAKIWIVSSLLENSEAVELDQAPHPHRPLQMAALEVCKQTEREKVFL